MKGIPEGAKVHEMAKNIASTRFRLAAHTLSDLRHLKQFDKISASLTLSSQTNSSTISWTSDLRRGVGRPYYRIPFLPGRNPKSGPWALLQNIHLVPDSLLPAPAKVLQAPCGPENPRNSCRWGGKIMDFVSHQAVPYA